MAQAGLEARLGTHVRTERSTVAAAKMRQADNTPLLDFPSDSGETSIGIGSMSAGPLTVTRGGWHSSEAWRASLLRPE